MDTAQSPSINALVPTWLAALILRDMALLANQLGRAECAAPRESESMKANRSLQAARIGRMQECLPLDRLPGWAGLDACRRFFSTGTNKYKTTSTSPRAGPRSVNKTRSSPSKRLIPLLFQTYPPAIFNLPRAPPMALPNTNHGIFCAV